MLKLDVFQLEIKSPLKAFCSGVRDLQASQRVLNHSLLASSGLASAVFSLAWK